MPLPSLYMCVCVCVNCCLQQARPQPEACAVDLSWILFRKWLGICMRLLLTFGTLSLLSPGLLVWHPVLCWRGACPSTSSVPSWSSGCCISCCRSSCIPLSYPTLQQPKLFQLQGRFFSRSLQAFTRTVKVWVAVE